MKIADEDRMAFTPAGAVRWDPAGQALVWTWEATIPTGYVVYLMLVQSDVKKGGIAKDTSGSTFKKRMQSEFAVVRQVIVGPIPGKPLPAWRLRPLDPFKKHAPPYLVAGHTVDSISLPPARKSKAAIGSESVASMPKRANGRKPVRHSSRR